MLCWIIKLFFPFQKKSAALEADAVLKKVEAKGFPVPSLRILRGNISDPPTQNRNKASEGEIDKIID